MQAEPAGADDPRGRIERGEVQDGRGARWIGADLSGLDLSGWDLSGADLSRAKLEGTRLVGANLTGASLFEADLTEADLSTADLCGANLESAKLSRAALGMARLCDARLVLAQLDGASLVGADLTGAQLAGCDLANVRLDRATLKGADLSRASLKGAELHTVEVADANFFHADLAGACLSEIRGFRQAAWLGVELRDVEFRGAFLCRNEILDQNYLEDFRKSSRGNAWIYWFWKMTSDCGRSLLRWTLCIAAVTITFAVVYSFVGVDYGDHRTPLSPLYFSIVTITTLGYGDVLPITWVAQLAVMTQVVIGYVMLGGLISLFANKLATRAG